MTLNSFLSVLLPLSQEPSVWTKTRAALQRTKTTDKVKLTDYRKDYPISQLHINHTEIQTRTTEQVLFTLVFVNNHVSATTSLWWTNNTLLFPVHRPIDTNCYTELYAEIIPNYNILYVPLLTLVLPHHSTHVLLLILTADFKKTCYFHPHCCNGNN